MSRLRQSASEYFLWLELFVKVYLFKASKWVNKKKIRHEVAFQARKLMIEIPSKTCSWCLALFLTRKNIEPSTITHLCFLKL